MNTRNIFVKTIVNQVKSNTNFTNKNDLFKNKKHTKPTTAKKVQ